MSVESLLIKKKDVEIAGKTVTVGQLTTRQVLSIVNFANQVKGSFNLDLSKFELNAETVMDLVNKLLLSLELDEKGEPSGPVAIFFTELGRILGIPAASLLDCPPDEIFVAATAIWEVNSNGPLGKSIRHTIGTFAPMMRMAKDMMLVNVQRELIKAAPSGGIPDGGMIVSSSQLQENSVGLMNTSLTESHSNDVSESSPALDTLTNSNPPLVPAEAQAEPGKATVPEATTAANPPNPPVI